MRSAWPAAGVLLLWSLVLSLPGMRLHASDQVVIRNVRLLQPGPLAAEVVGPHDLRLRDGHLAEIAPPGSIALEPGDFRVLGDGCWLVPAPTVRLQRLSRASDLVLAGLSGLAGLQSADPPDTKEALWARAALDTEALPRSLSTEEPVHVELQGASEGAPTLERLVTAVGGPDRLLDRLVAPDGARIEVGAPARFLLLASDPRLEPDGLLSPRAVIQGQEVVLQSERLVRLEEASRAARLEPLPRPVPVEGRPASARRYALVIDGLHRGEAWLELDPPEAAGGAVTVRSRIAAPLEERLEATIDRSDGRTSFMVVTGDRRITGGTEPQGVGKPLRLELLLDGNPVPGSPIDLSDPDDRLLPHTLLVLLDALPADPSGRLQGRVLELELHESVPGLFASPRLRARPPTVGEKPLLALQHLERLAGRGPLTRLVLPVEGDPSAPASLYVGSDGLPVWFLQSTPWGLLEWHSWPQGGGAVSKSAPLPEDSHNSRLDGP